MRTESSPDSTTTSLSRRGFVVGAGAAIAPVASGGASDDGARTGSRSADDATGGDQESVTVEATRPYLPAVRAMVAAFNERSSTAPLGVRRTDGGPVERLRDGPADVHVSGRPTPSLDDAVSAEFDRIWAVHGWAVLAIRRDEWYDSLRSGALRDRLRTADWVETWRESDWQTVTALQERAERDERPACTGLTSTGEDGTAIVRGTRAFQYARGHGGVAYYEVPRAAVGAPSTARERGDGLVPLVRLGYLRTDAAPESPTAEFLAFYRAEASGVLDDGGAEGSERERVTSTA